MFAAPPTTGLQTVRLERPSVAAGTPGAVVAVGHAGAARRGLQIVALVLVVLFGGLGIAGAEAPLLESSAPLAATATLLAVASTVRRAARASSRRRSSRRAISPVTAHLVPASVAAATFDDPPRGPPAYSV